MSKRQELSGGSRELQPCGIPTFYTKIQKWVLTQNVLNTVNAAVYAHYLANQSMTN